MTHHLWQLKTGFVEIKSTGIAAICCVPLDDQFHAYIAVHVVVPLAFKKSQEMMVGEMLMYPSFVELYLSDYTAHMCVVRITFQTTIKGMVWVYFFLTIVTLKKSRIIFHKRERVVVIFMHNSWW